MKKTIVGDIFGQYQKSREKLELGRLFTFPIDEKDFWLVGDKIWRDFEQKYKGREYQKMEG